MTPAARAAALLVGLSAIHSGAMATAARAADDACAGKPEALGVSRIVEIDASSAPKFGAQYASASFLEDGEVVLTFDDGPLRHYTQRVLDALDQHCTRATFFIVGRMAVADPDMLKEMARRGHTIGIHTWSHKKQTTISAAKGKEEIELGLSATALALGGPVAPFFRFPYLAHTRAALGHLASRQIGTFGIDVDSRDFQTRNPGQVQRTVLAQLKAQRKGIILFHDIQPSTAGAIKSLLAALKAEGYRVVHMTPKTAATTLPEYDARAAELLARKVVAATKSPLATRSAVWSNSSEDATASDAAPAPKSKRGTVKPAAADAALPAVAGEELPWLKGTTTDGVAAPPAPRLRPPRRPEPPGVEHDPWQIRMLPGG
jgi:peptidoglycan/xylan/chitin deacetylase (PgdA/CDA1 family)